MSYLGYFKASIENWKKCDKKTPTRIHEMKELINQFYTSEQYDEFADQTESDVLKVKRELEEIRKIFHK